jgi:hypothetical protein
MKTEFIQPRFTGSRFNEHTLPVDMLRDLAAYESLLVELAKHLYKQEHPERQRVPKDFFSDFHLSIEQINEGSAILNLVLVVSGSLILPDGVAYFERARDLVTECIEARETLPQQFPKELLSHFNQFGRSLRDDETIELRRAGSEKTAILTPDRRKRLALAADQVYEREVELAGSIVEMDTEKMTFRLRLIDDKQAIIPVPESFRERVKQSLGRDQDYVIVKGIATYDSWDRLQKVISVEWLEVINFPLISRFIDLSLLKDGWHNGEGKALDRGKLNIVAQNLVCSYPERLPLPIIAPTPEGNLLLEWNTQGLPSIDICLSDMRASFHAFGQAEEDIEKDFSLNTASDWKDFFEFIANYFKRESA